MRRFFSLILSTAIAFNIAGCTVQNADPQDKDLYVIGFSQVGSESDWRIANSQSMIETFTEDKGYELRMVNARQNQDNQLAAVRTFILEGVDFIVIAPVVEEGWDSVLAEVRASGIPVIIMDRSVSVSDNSLYLSNIGSDFLNQGTMAVEWLEEQTETGDLGQEERGLAEGESPTEEVIEDEGTDETDTLRILHLQGTYGATAQLMRTQALEDAVEVHDNWEFAAQICGDYTEAKAYEVVSEYLSEDTDIDVLYSENDNMTFGAMRAMDDAGITYGDGGQVTIITFDATREALQYCLDGDIALCVECNPILGPAVEELISDYRNGNSISRQVYVPETTYTASDLTQEFIDSRIY